ncbi:alkyl/aryl-sulfatase [Yinghuangia seranimata]|uniref:alkyl/aryl-sulfatase n=1 Tax=Yinghuangia seranimata TaxID=408067 RepID=UPI00248AE32A|nr:alkyl sulfatase dimerization domain-containing protein [Yinghuangia seranimata]MDI2127637.1 alkyl sulfatase dimerization domain-containing protein [Yinghuangia seranimata]
MTTPSPTPADLPPFEDRTDFEDADRGFVAAFEPGVVEDADGRVVWDANAYAFIEGDCPETADPSLWRQAQLVARQGLYEVADGIFQVRGLDLSNMTLVEGDTGVIVVDPLVSAETAAAALELYRAHRGDRPVTGLIYTHSHVDHFGGARGVLPDGSRGIPVIAPVGFLEHAVAENVYAGNAMTRRAVYMYGDLLPKGPAGQIGAGLGMTTSHGTVTLIPPTIDVTATGQQETVDGVPVVFQLTPGTEAPAEMNFLFPDRRALCLAENCSHTMHNVLTLRGALVRDPRMWARYLDEAIDLFTFGTDVAFGSHHWPTWGTDRVIALMAGQRDMYAYMHDQTLRLLNAGLTGTEIAEELKMPPALERSWHARGYYGSLSHNVKAVYQRYMGWFDGNPAHLWEHPPVAQSRRLVDCMGGIDAVVAKARAYMDDGDLRFAATLLNHAVFAAPDASAATEARGVLAQVYDTLGHGAENGPWRNFFLMGAAELRDGVTPPAVDTTGSVGLTGALTVDQILDSVAVAVDGPACWEDHLVVDFVVTDEGRTWQVSLTNGVLTHRSTRSGLPTRETADLTLTLTKERLLGVLHGRGLDGIAADGDRAVLRRLASYVEDPDPAFPIVTP